MISPTDPPEVKERQAELRAMSVDELHELGDKRLARLLEFANASERLPPVLTTRAAAYCCEVFNELEQRARELEAMRPFPPDAVTEPTP